MNNGDLMIYTQKAYFWRSPIKFYGVYHDGKVAYIKKGKLAHKEWNAIDIPLVIRIPKGRKHIAQAHIDVGLAHDTLDLVNGIFGTNHSHITHFYA